MKKVKLLLAFSVLTAGFTWAWPMQQSSSNAEHPEPRKGATLYWAEAGSHLTVTGVPFTANLVVETTQTLADGNHLVSRSTQKLARDSKGRTRREQTIGKVGSLQVDGPTLIFIYDPVAQLEYTLDPVQHTARVTKLRMITLPNVDTRDIGSGSASARSRQMGDRKFTSEPLGSQTIEGLNAEGNRLTVTFAVGALGNERPFSTSTETWFSSDLQESLLRRRVDPRTGETVSRLTDIQRAEPDPSLFQIPPDYKIISMPEPGPRE